MLLPQIKFIAGDNEQRIAIGQISSIEVREIQTTEKKLDFFFFFATGPPTYIWC